MQVIKEMIIICTIKTLSMFEICNYNYSYDNVKINCWLANTGIYWQTFSGHAHKILFVLIAYERAFEVS